MMMTMIIYEMRFDDSYQILSVDYGFVKKKKKFKAMFGKVFNFDIITYAVIQKGKEGGGATC